MKEIRIKKVLLFLCAAVFLFSSCKEDQIDTFSGETNVYFSLKRWGSGSNGYSYAVTNFPVEDSLYSGSWSTITAARDSLIASLAFDGTDQGYHVALIPVSISGNVVDYDRPLDYTLAEHTTAVAGKHFQAEGMIPANKRIGAIAVRLNRASFKDTTFVIDFNLVANEHFRINYTTINRSASDTAKVNLQQFRLYASSFLEKSAYWDTRFLNYLGAFSRKKVFLILEITGGDIEVLYKADASADLIIAWGKTLKNYLAEQKAQGNTIYEEDGTEMTAGSRV